jgi:hypothetical protein
MNWKDFGAAFTEFLRNIWLWMIVIARRHSMALVGSALVVLAAMTLWSWYRDFRTTEYTILVGPGGSMSEDDARQIKRRIESQSSWIGADYRVSMQETQGFEEVRRLINADETGRLFGFAHDGFGNAENVRVLLPLDRNYLHIVASRKFLKRLVEPPTPSAGATAPSAPGDVASRKMLDLDGPITFADLAAYRGRFAPARWSLGPPDSGTRQLAEIVMKRYGLDANLYQTNGVKSWYDMRAALNNDAIDVAFYSSRMDADIMKLIAADRSSVMIGLDGDRDAIIQGQWHLQEQVFNKNSYANSGFCPAALETFSSRRVLLCSSSMTEPTAYFLAKHSRDALRTVVPEIDWVNPPPDAPQSTGLTYQIHPGAELYRTKSPLGGVPWNSNYLVMTLALWLVTELVQSANKRLRSKPIEDGGPPSEAMPVANEPPATSAPAVAAAAVAAAPDPAAVEAASRETYDSLEREIDDYTYSLVAMPALSKSQRADWLQKLEQQRGRIQQLHGEGGLVDRHAEALLSAIDRLASAMTLRNGKPHVDGPRKRLARRSK